MISLTGIWPELAYLQEPQLHQGQLQMLRLLQRLQQPPEPVLLGRHCCSALPAQHKEASQRQGSASVAGRSACPRASQVLYQGAAFCQVCEAYLVFMQPGQGKYLCSLLLLAATGRCTCSAACERMAGLIQDCPTTKPTHAPPCCLAYHSLQHVAITCCSAFMSLQVP